MKSRKSYLYKLIAYAVCLITFPVAVLGVFSYIHASATVQRTVNDGALQMLLQMQQRVEQSLRTADNALTQFSLRPSVLKLLAAPDGPTDSLSPNTDYAAIEELREGLRSLQLSDLNVSDVQFIHLRDRWRASKSGYAPLTDSDAGATAPYSSSPGSRWTISSRTIDFVKTLPIGSTEPVAVMMFQLPYGEIGKYMFKHPELGEPFILDAGFRVVAHTDHWTRTGTSAASMPYAAEMQHYAEDSGLFRTTLEDQPYNALYSKSSYNGWTYMSLLSVTEMTRASKAIQWATLAVCAALLLIGFALSFTGASRLYGPIRRLYESVFRDAAEEAPAASANKSKDELLLIGERVHAALRNEKQLRRELQSQQDQLQHYFLLRLYLGQTEAEERAVYEALLQQRWQAMNVLVLQIDTLDGTGYEESDKELLLFAVSNIVADVVPARDRLLQPIVMGASQVTLLGSPSAEGTPRNVWLNETAEQVRQIVKQVLRLPVSIGVSTAFQTLGEANRCYREAGEALQYRIRLGQETIVHIGDVQPDRNLVPHYPEKLKNELIEAVGMGDGERAGLLLAQIASEMFAAPLSHRQYQMLMIALLTDLLRNLQQYDGLLQSLYEEEKQLYDRLFELKTSAEVVEWLRGSIISPAIRMIEERKYRQHRSIADEMLRMIEEEYDQPLTVEQCALRMHYHPDYIRHVFRKETGMTFSDCLAGHRLKIAKQWLRQTDMKIVDIAHKLQYTNAQNFIRYFRKMEDMTPGQYRASAPDVGPAESV